MITFDDQLQHEHTEYDDRNELTEASTHSGLDGTRRWSGWRRYAAHRRRAMAVL